MNDITIFNHLGNSIRVMTDMKGVRPVDTLGGTQQLTVMTDE